jgi:hypothetical protein
MPHPARRSFEAVIRERPVAAFSAGFALLLAILFFDPLFLGRTFVSRDLIPFFLPIEKAVHAAWRSGHVPLLIPEISFGRPLAANPNTGVFYPVRMAMALLPFTTAFKLFPVLHIWLAGLGCFLLARFWGASSAGSAVGAVAFALGGPALSEIMDPDFLPGLAWMPFVILLAGRLAERPSGRRAAAFGSIWGLSLLVGDVFTSGLAFLGAALLTIERGVPGRRPRALGRLALSTLPGFFLAGVQLLPALLFVPHTVRALGRFPVKVALMWSVSLWRFLELVLPFPFGSPVRQGTSWGYVLWGGKSVGFFNTLYPGVLASLALVVFRPPRGRRAFLYGFLVATMVLAVAGFYCPKSWLNAASPIPLRYPEKFMVGFSLAGALVLAAMADDLLDRLSGKRFARAALAFGIATGTALLVTVCFPSATRDFVFRNWSNSRNASLVAQRTLPGSFAAAAATWLAAGALLAWSARKPRRARVAIALLAFVGIDLGWRRFQFVTTGNQAELLSPPPAAKVIRAINENGRYGYLPIEDYFATATDWRELFSDVAATFAIPYAFNQDYDASDLYRVDLARQQIYRDAGRWKGMPEYLAGFSVRSAICESHRMPFGFSARGPVIGPKWVVINPLALPRLRLAGAVREVDGPVAAYAAIHDREEDLAAVTVVETGREAEYRSAAGRARELVSAQDRLEVETTTDGPARLILPRAFFPYRRFLLDGAAIEASATNLCLTSVAIPAGKHLLVVEETLPGGKSGLLISAAGALMILLLSRRDERRVEIP